jgi:hypothetical protein
MNSNNVITFPKQNINKSKPTVSIEEIEHNLEMMRHYHIQETIANLAPIVFNQLEIAGFPISDEENTDIKDGAFIVESLRSLMCKYYGIYHPFQQISDGVFSPDENEIGALRIVDKLNLELKKSETA